MENFFERWKPVFEVVCRILGNGWRVNMLDDCIYRIKLTSPQFKNYSVHIRMEKGRLKVLGSVDSRYWRSPWHSCTFSPERNPVFIAADIQKKILVNASEDVKKAQEYEQILLTERDEKMILKGMLTQLLNLDSCYGKLTGFKADNGLSGHINQQGKGFDISVRELNVDQLIVLAGFIKTL